MLKFYISVDRPGAVLILLTLILLPTRAKQRYACLRDRLCGRRFYSSTSLVTQIHQIVGSQARLSDRCTARGATRSRRSAPVSPNITGTVFVTASRILDASLSRDRRRRVHRLASGTCIARRRSCGSGS